MNDVLVVGAGPVGLTMALELARYGLRVRIVDRNPQRTDKSKAIVIWARTLELMERMGAGTVERFAAAGEKVGDAFILAGREEIAHVDLATIDSPYRYVLMLAQSETERLLEEELLRRGIKVERQVELTEFAEEADSVRCTLRHADGSQETTAATWLVGCDGAHSTVRHTLGMSFEGSTLLNDWILADLHIDGMPEPAAIRIYWHADGVLATFPLGGTRYRVIADVGESRGEIGEGNRAAPTLDKVQRVLDLRCPEGLKVNEAVWLSSFSINERKVAEYRQGRVFLAGDAAHVHSPAGGQGMNTGIQDACNLAWKLAMVTRGLAAPEMLLDSYSEERSGVAKLVLEATGKATAMAVAHGGVKQSIRNHMASMIFGFAPVRHTVANVLSEISVSYGSSPLNEQHGYGVAMPEAGRRAPMREGEAPVGAGQTPRFALFADDGDLYAQVLEEYRVIVEPVVRRPFESGGLWLVRPDGYVGLRARAGDVAAVRRYLGRVAGPAVA
ncbi:MAG TPA: FAD-dependent oxidoreductase [Edaphobacter sp.]